MLWSLAMFCIKGRAPFPHDSYTINTYHYSACEEGPKKFAHVCIYIGRLRWSQIVEIYTHPIGLHIERMRQRTGQPPRLTALWRRGALNATASTCFNSNGCKAHTIQQHTNTAAAKLPCWITESISTLVGLLILWWAASTLRTYCYPSWLVLAMQHFPCQPFEDVFPTSPGADATIPQEQRNNNYNTSIAEMVITVATNSNVTGCNVWAGSLGENTHLQILQHPTAVLYIRILHIFLQLLFHILLLLVCRRSHELRVVQHQH